MVRVTAAVLAAQLLICASAFAGDPPSQPAPGIRASIANLRIEPHDRYAVASMQGTSGHNGTAQKVTAGIAMGFLGLLAGAYIGSRLEGNCRCDDPGLGGMMVGAPIGAIAGAIAGVKLASR